MRPETSGRTVQEPATPVPAAATRDRPLDLPPPYTLVALRELGDAFAHACRIAGEAGAGTFVWVGRFDLLEFAVVLEPEEPLERARRAVYAGMTALADAVAAYSQPEKPLDFGWPDALALRRRAAGRRTPRLAGRRARGRRARLARVFRHAGHRKTARRRARPDPGLDLAGGRGFF